MAKTVKTIYLRVPPALYYDLKRMAKGAASVNSVCVKLLQAATKDGADAHP